MLALARRATGTVRLGRAGLASRAGAGGPQLSEEELEKQKLGVFDATGGMLVASLAAAGVFAVGAVATLGVASSAASLLGHSMGKAEEEQSPAPALPPEVVLATELATELAELRQVPRSRETDKRRREIQKELAALAR